LSSERTTFLIRTVAIIFFIIGFVSNIIISISAKSPSPLIIIIGLEFLIYLLLSYFLVQSKQ
jgi:hypothetical protein